MDDDAGPQTLFLLVSWNSFAPYYSSIIKLETQVHNHEYASSSANAPVFQTEFSAHIPRLSPLPISWAFSLPPASSTEDLYMLPDWSPRKPEGYKMPGFIVNLNTKKCKIIKPPMGPKFMGHVVTIGDHIYFMAQPRWHHTLDACFERYDTLSQSWEKLEPLPLFTDRSAGNIEGCAVLDDTILFNFHGRKMWAYNVGRNKRYPVRVKDDLCYNIVEVAVVLNKIIYALTVFCESVVALTLKSQEIEGDLVFTCDLHIEYVVPGMEPLSYELWDSVCRTRHLVHLGKDNFCVVQSCILDGVINQYMHLTYIEVSAEKLIVTNRCVHEFKLRRHGEKLMIRRCFSMPTCKTTALKEGNREQEAEIVTLPPELLQFMDKYSSQTNIIDEQGGGSVSQTSQNRDDGDTTTEVQEDVPKKSSASVVKASTLGDSHSIFVTNLPPDANYLKFFKGLNRFGPIKNFILHIDHNNASESFADVEFESATSKQNAIKASVIKIGDRRAVIEEKRGTGLTQGGSVSQTSQSRDDADTKTPQVQEGVPKKSSASVVKASTLEDGHSIFVTNLPPDANYGQFLKGLKRFGPIKSLTLNIDHNNMSESFADVEFESAASKQNAIKASVIKIGDHLAVIEEKRVTSLTQVSQSSPSRDDADTTPQVQEDVPKKSSATVVAAKSNVPSKASTVTGHRILIDATLGDGHSICVTNLPPDANCAQFFKEMMRFGTIKSFNFLIDPNNPSESFADVEFERATSKQNAIKASIIKILGREVVIEEKRGTGLAQGGLVSQTSQSRDDAYTKTRQVQEDVHSVSVTNLPLDTNSRQLVKRLKRFGLIKSVGIKTYFHTMSECCFAHVEFESATSKQNAIKESILKIGNHIAVIEEKRGTGFTQGDSDRSSSSPRNKLKKRDFEDYRSKTSRKGLSRITSLPLFTLESF